MIKAIIEVKFLKVAGEEVPFEDRKVRQSMENAVKKLVESTKKFYKDFRIETEINWKLENGR